jgi:hypothetical protein
MAHQVQSGTVSLIQEITNNKSGKNWQSKVIGTPFNIRRYKHLEKTKFHETSMYKEGRRPSMTCSASTEQDTEILVIKAWKTTVLHRNPWRSTAEVAPVWGAQKVFV